MVGGWIDTWLPEIPFSILTEADHALRPWLFVIVIHKILQREESWHERHKGSEWTYIPRFVHLDDDIGPEIETASLEPGKRSHRDSTCVNPMRCHAGGSLFGVGIKSERFD